MAVYAVEACIQTSAKEPSIVAIDKRALVNGVEVLVPAQKIPSELGPKPVGILNRLLVEGQIFREAIQMWFRRMLAAIEDRL